MPDEGAEPVTQGEGAGGEKIGQWLGAILEPLDMGHQLRALDRELEAIGRLAGPAGEARRFLIGPEGGVDFDTGQAAGGIGQLPFLHEALRKEGAAPGFEDPAGGAGPDRSNGAHAILPRWPAWPGGPDLAMARARIRAVIFFCRIWVHGERDVSKGPPLAPYHHRFCDRRHPGGPGTGLCAGLRGAAHGPGRAGHAGDRRGYGGA